MYRIDIPRRAAKQVAKLPGNYPRLVTERIHQLTQNPRPPGAIRLTNSPLYRLRVGVYRILYEIDEAERLVTVYRVGHRREVYR